MVVHLSLDPVQVASYIFIVALCIDSRYLLRPRGEFMEILIRLVKFVNISL